MNNSSEQKAGGASITPSARPSIHHHKGACAFRLGETLNVHVRESMGRYGLKKPEKDENSPNDQGRDEVDNVMSKLARAPSPLAARRCAPKRKSFDGSSYFTSEEDISANHSKSLPSSFLSHSYCSDESGQWSREFSNSSSESFRNVRQENDHNESQERRHGLSNEKSTNILKNSHKLVQGESRNPRIQNLYTNSSQRSTYSPNVADLMNRTPATVQYDYHRERLSTSQGSQTKFLLGVLSSVAVAMALYVGDYLPITANESYSSTINQYNSDTFNRDLNYIGEKHNIRDDSILQLQTAISTIVKNQDTGSFVLAYNSNKKNFDQDEFDVLVNFIASTASKYLRNDSTSVRHIVVDGSKLEVRSHSELLNKYRDDVTKTGVMLVREVDEVPSALAMAFHYYCDEFNPVVKKSAIFFTLDMTKCYNTLAEQKATYGQIEKCLRNKWSGVPQDNISPLLNRVVNTIVDVAGD